MGPVGVLEVSLAPPWAPLWIRFWVHSNPMGLRCREDRIQHPGGRIGYQGRPKGPQVGSRTPEGSPKGAPKDPKVARKDPKGSQGSARRIPRGPPCVPENWFWNLTHTSSKLNARVLPPSPYELKIRSHFGLLWGRLCALLESFFGLGLPLVALRGSCGFPLDSLVGPLGASPGVVWESVCWEGALNSGECFDWVGSRGCFAR